MNLDDEWLAGIDIDAMLHEICNDDRLPWILRSFAGASVGIDPASGYHMAAELCEAVDRIEHGDATGERDLAAILGRGGSDYQRCLWYIAAGREPRLVTSCFAEFRVLMAARLRLWDELCRRGLTSVKSDAPYSTGRPGYPRAIFDQRTDAPRVERLVESCDPLSDARDGEVPPAKLRRRSTRIAPLSAAATL